MKAYTLTAADCCGPLCEIDVTASEMFGAAIDLGRRYPRSTMMISVYMDGESPVCWAAKEAFYIATDIGSDRRAGLDCKAAAAEAWTEAKIAARAGLADGRDAEWLDHAREELYEALYWHGRARATEAA